MYFGRRRSGCGGHASLGRHGAVDALVPRGGRDGRYFTTFVLLANPNDEPADVTLTYLPETGVPVTQTYTIPGRSAPDAQHRARRLHARQRRGRDARRSDAPDHRRARAVLGRPRWIEAHNSFGVTAAATRWGLAEGRVGGAGRGADVHPARQSGHEAASVTITFLRDGGTPVVKTFTSAAHQPLQRRRVRARQARARTGRRILRRAHRIDAADRRRTLALQRRERHHLGRRHERHRHAPAIAGASPRRLLGLQRVHGVGPPGTAGRQPGG